MKAMINDVYYKDINTPIELGATKGEAPWLDAYRFRREPRFSVEIEEGPEPSDGNKHALLVGMFIDKVEVPFVTEWLPNQEKQRSRVYTFDIPKSPVKLMKAGKVHSVQFKIGGRAYKFGIPMILTDRVYDLGESEVFYYRFADLEDGSTPGGWDSDGGSGSAGGCSGDCGGGGTGGGTCNR
jgi:hypothetical protein